MELKIYEIAELPREDVIGMLMDFPGKFRLDFTYDYLQQKDTEQLRHMLLAAYLHVTRDSK